MDPEMAEMEAVGQEEVARTIQPAMHTQETEVQVPKPQEEESRLPPNGNPGSGSSNPSNYKNCSILDMQQMLEVWYDKSTFAIATWRGDAQRYWLTQVLEPARARHEQWLQSPPAQRATLEPAYALGGRKHILDAANAVESILRTELLDVIPKPLPALWLRRACDMVTVPLSSLSGTSGSNSPFIQTSMRSPCRRRSSLLRKFHLPPLNKHASGSKRCNID